MVEGSLLRRKKHIRAKTVYPCASKLLVIAAVTAIAVLTSLNASADPWWHPDWDYRIAVAITDNSGTELSDHQVSLPIDTAALISAGQTRADGGDIRFTDAAATPIPYWIASGIGTAETIIWVKIPRIPASGQSIVYMYSGNPAATSESNGDAVFLFFDDFATNTVGTKWGQGEGTTATIADGHAKVPLRGNNYLYTMATFPRPFTMTSRVRSDVPSGAGDFIPFSMLYMFYDDEGPYLWRRAYECAELNNRLSIRATGRGTIASTPQLTAAQTYYLLSGVLSDTHIRAVLYDDSRELLNDVAACDDRYNDQNIALDAYEPSYHARFAYFDWVLVRKYASAEPSVTVREAAGAIAGSVTCGGAPVWGATIDLFAPEAPEDLLGSCLTDEAGVYEFAEWDARDYTVEVVAPLGFQAAQGWPLEVIVTVSSGETVSADFILEQVECVAEARGMGYWKHQYKVHASGHGQAAESVEDLTSYQIEIWSHFFDLNDQYAIRIPAVTYSGSLEEPTCLTFDDALATLAARGSIPMIERAYREFLALLLNVVSDRLRTHHQASEDGSTVSQVITHVAALLTDQDPENHELAKDLAAMVNASELIPAATIPPDTPNIAYRRTLEPVRSTLSLAQPNPAGRFTCISYTVPPSGADVSLMIYDHAGRLVRSLLRGMEPGGVQQVVWFGDDDHGRHLAGGVYFYRINVGDRSESRKIILR